MSAYTDLLDGFCREFELPESFARTGQVVIDGVALALRCEDDLDVRLLALLGEPTPGQELAVYREMLAANTLWEGSSGCTLGLYLATGQLTLSLIQPFEGLDNAGLAALLDHAVETALAWQARVRALAPAGASAPEAGLHMLLA